MNLRPYQKQAVKKIYREWDRGHKNVMLQLPTGGGKTVIFSHILSGHKGASIVIVHRVELVHQASLLLAKNGIPHNFIAPKATIKEIVDLHLTEYGKNFYHPYASCTVASVDTLVKRDALPWYSNVTLVIQDEGHHVLRENKWGKAQNLFPNAKGLFPTATPCRADGRGLGRHADGLADTLVQGAPMKNLIEDGFLSTYRVFAPASTLLDLSEVPITPTGDYNVVKLRLATRQASITGDVVAHYCRIAKGKSGVTFAVDIRAAEELRDSFNAEGIPAELITSKTAPLERNAIMKKFKNRELLQLVNVDILGEGVDVPAIEVVSMARPTASYGLYCQQFGRSLRPMKNKKAAIIIDHVGNVKRHGLPDTPRTWTLDRRERKAATTETSASLIKICLNPLCCIVYAAYLKRCPECNTEPELLGRTSPEEVEGDLIELSPEILAQLRSRVIDVDAEPIAPSWLTGLAQAGYVKTQERRQEDQIELRESIAQWAGFFHPQLSDREIQKLFFLNFNIDLLSAQSLISKDAKKLKGVVDTLVKAMIA